MKMKKFKGERERKKVAGKARAVFLGMVKQHVYGLAPSITANFFALAHGRNKCSDLQEERMQKHFAIAICISQTYIVLSSHLSELLRSLAVSSPSLTMAIIEASPLNNNTLKGASQKQTKTPKEDPTPMFKDLLFNMVARRRM